MNTHSTLFTQVNTFYTHLISGLESAQAAISMMYFTFSHGEWSEKISQMLCERAADGVRTRLMVDEFGLVMDRPKHILLNLMRIQELQEAGVQVDIFRPTGRRLSRRNRLHFKVCAIDQHTVFIGGSNIGDHYVEWDDSNLRMVGRLGGTFHDLYDYVGQFSWRGEPGPGAQFHLSTLEAGDAQIRLTVPKQRHDIRRALLGVILDAEESIYIRNWYFLPDSEVLNALRSQAENGVEVNVLLSHRTRVPLVDIANYIHCNKLAKSGGRVYRYTSKYMHAKVAWNNRGEVLFGSANMDAQALESSFECCVVLQDQVLADELRKAFEADQRLSFLQTPGLYRQRSIPQKALSHACNLASSWL